MKMMTINQFIKKSNNVDEAVEKAIKEIGKWLQNEEFELNCSNTTSIDIIIHINPTEVINVDIVQNKNVTFSQNEEE